MTDTVATIDRSPNLTANSLLRTKLFIPQARHLQDLLPRPRLVEHLQAGLSRKLTLLSAPTGFGKSTLLVDWIATTGDTGDAACPTFCWLSLDAGDNDPVRFWSYVIAALQTAQPTLGAATLAVLAAPQSPPLEASLTPLLNELAILPTACVLVLDDYHVIDNPTIHNSLSFLLDHLPDPFHLILSSRADPPLSLARLRARGQMTEIRADDLRFHSTESAAFLNEVMDLQLATEAITTLAARTEGWIAGLQLAAISLQGCNDPAGFVQTFSGTHRYIVDYLVDEVLQQQPAEVQIFLLHTAILDRLCAGLCNALTGRRDGQAMLKQMEQANLFLTPLDEGRRWWRYHHLFAEVLRERLGETLPDPRPELHRRASLWYEQNGMILEAVNHALLAPDFVRAAQLIEPVAQHLIAGGEATTLLSWLQALPAEQVQSNAPLSLATALAQLIAGEFTNIAPSLQNAEQALLQQTDTTTNRRLWHERNAIRAIIAMEEQATPEQIEQARQTLAQLSPDNRFLRGALAYSLGSAYSASGETRAASQAFAEARLIGHQSNHWLTALIASYELAELAVEQGELQRAQTIHQEAIQWMSARISGRGNQPPPLAGAAHIGLGKLYYEWNDLEAARHHLSLGMELTQAVGGLGVARHGLPTLAFVCQAQGDAAAANRLLQQAEKLARRSPRTDAVARLQPYQVRLWLAQGDLAAAWRWLQASRVDPQPGDTRLPLDLDALLRARVYLTQPTTKHLTQAAAWLAQALPVAEAQGRNGRVIEILLLQALVYHAQGDDRRALTLLQRSLALAEPEGYTRTFVDEGAPLRRLLAKFSRWLTEQPGVEPPTQLLAYANKLFSALGDSPITLATLKIQNQKPEIQNLLEPLTERELAVLRLMAAGLSNQEIAETMIIAEGTVKKHTHNIFGKLGVRGRTQAILRATELKLL